MVLSMAYKWKVLTTYQSWDDPPNSGAAHHRNLEERHSAAAMTGWNPPFMIRVIRLNGHPSRLTASQPKKTGKAVENHGVAFCPNMFSWVLGFNPVEYSKIVKLNHVPK